MIFPSDNYTLILTGLKEKIRQARMKAALTVNTQLLSLYWEIGHTLHEQEKIEGWGAKTIDVLAKDLRHEFPDMKGFSTRNLRYMRDFARAYPLFLILQDPAAKLQTNENKRVIFLQQTVAKLPWGHNCTLLDRVKDPEERLFYAGKAIENGWSRDMMVNQFESGLFKRQGALTHNFSHTVTENQSDLAKQIFKDPYHFDFLWLGEEARERDLENALIDHISKMLLEMGDGFAFMGRQFRLEAGGQEYFLDLLFYHTKLRRHVVIELKVGDFKPEYAGKMNFYLTLVDERFKDEHHEPAIGLILCKSKNRIIAEYALRDTSKPIGIAEYKLNEQLPEDIKGQLPSIEELEAEIDREYQELKNPAQKRFDSLKARLMQLKTDEIKQTATYPILCDIIDQSLVPMFEMLLDRLNEFKEMFLSCEYHWQGKNEKLQELQDLAATWKDEAFIQKHHHYYFSFWLKGFKKAGIDSFNAGFQLDYVISTYYYGIRLVNYNDQQPFIRKLYHEQLNKNEMEKVCDVICNQIMDEIERGIERISPE